MFKYEALLIYYKKKNEDGYLSKYAYAATQEEYDAYNEYTIGGGAEAALTYASRAQFTKHLHICVDLYRKYLNEDHVKGMQDISSKQQSSIMEGLFNAT